MIEPKKNDAGFTVIESIVALAIFSIVAYGIFLSIGGALGAFDIGKTKSELQDMGRKVLKKMIHELKGSGIYETVSLNYPSIYEFDPDVGSRGNWLGSLSFSDSEITETTGNWQDRRSRNKNRISNEIVFRLPQDLDGDGYLTDNSTGEIEWSSDLISYKVVKAPNGVYQLERHVNGSFSSLMGRFVKKVTFDAIVFDTTVKYNQTVITVFLERKTDAGHTIEVALEGTVSLRNTREL